jgi:hypothetical protein
MAASVTNKMEILNQTCLKFKSFREQNLDFPKFPQKAETRDTRNFEKDKMICNITAEIRPPQVDLVPDRHIFFANGPVKMRENLDISQALFHDQEYLYTLNCVTVVLIYY